MNGRRSDAKAAVREVNWRARPPRQAPAAGHRAVASSRPCDTLARVAASNLCPSAQEAAVCWWARGPGVVATVRPEPSVGCGQHAITHPSGGGREPAHGYSRRARREDERIGDRSRPEGTSPGRRGLAAGDVISGAMFRLMRNSATRARTLRAGAQPEPVVSRRRAAARSGRFGEQDCNRSGLPSQLLAAARRTLPSGAEGMPLPRCLSARTSARA